ncbi:MAG TPA: IS110 family transposase [Herpetosiphonaceae bacterium]
MQIIHTCCCGLDVPKKQIVACLLQFDAAGHSQPEIRTFTQRVPAMTQDILVLADWLTTAGCTHVAMERTGVYWKPVYNLLEGLFALLVVNAHHVKAVPGRKTDVKDAEWLADLLQHGLLRASFVPPTRQRELRDLTRHRSTLVAERARIVNRLQKVLEDANIKLAAVASDIAGVSARAILQGLLDGETDVQVLSKLAKGRMRSKRALLEQALVGRMRPHHAFLITEHLSHLNYVDESIARFTNELQERLYDADTDIALLDTIPGVSRRAAEVILAEIGRDMGRFPSAKHLASWAGMCPGNHERAGKRTSGNPRKGSRWLRQVLIEAAHGAAHTKHTYLGALYRRMQARRGTKKALVAVGHAMLVIIYYVLSRKEPYQDLGANSFDARDRQAVQRRLVRRLEQLGYQVTVQTSTAPSEGVFSE